MRHYFHELDTGAFALNAPTRRRSRSVTGREAESFETIARRYATQPQMRPTPGNISRALIEFLSVPFRPGLNPRRYERQLALPRASAPVYDMASERWTFEHAVQGTGRARTRGRGVVLNDESLPPTDETLKRQVVTRLALWCAGVASASASGLLSKVPARLMGPLIFGGIVAPTVAYAKSPQLKALAREVGIHKLSLFHTWRVVGDGGVSLLRFQR